MKVLAVGDIHTKLWIIEAVKSVVDNYDTIVFVGDYVDDWGKSPDESIKSWQALKDFQDKYPEKVKLVIGNHDYIYLHHTPTISSGYNKLTQLLINSKENAGLKAWLYTIPVTLDIDGVTYSHAGITDTFEMEYMNSWDLWNDDSPLWARPNYNVYTLTPQVFGHTPSRTCHRVTENIWCIDTFSTYPDGSPVGDHTVLEVTDGKKFNKIKLETNNDNNNISGIKS